MSSGVVLLCLVLMTTGVFGQFGLFEFSCPVGCQDRVCSASIGCTRCLPGYCTYFSRRPRRVGGVCLRTCPRGYRCQTALGTFRFCTQIRD